MLRITDSRCLEPARARDLYIRTIDKITKVILIGPCILVTEDVMCGRKFVTAGRRTLSSLYHL
jgi:hypothetical protein